MIPLLFLFCVGAVAAEAPKDFQLPGNAIPRGYAVSLAIDPSKETFQGKIDIQVDLRTAANVIWLNAKELSDVRGSVTWRGRRFAARVTQTDDEFLALQLDDAIGDGRVEIHLDYAGQLRESPAVGAFHTKFEDRWYAFTTFTAIEARRAFPCFDEPRFKTSWQLTLRIPANNRAFSNTKEAGESQEADGTKVVRFASTPPLASEVIAFAVGPFSVLKGGRAGSKHVPVRVVTPLRHESEGASAASMTGAIVSGLERYTGIPYPWEKLDDVALPQSTFGGVEQPGMITYRMRSLLRAPDGQPDPAKDETMRSLLTHEMAHQWFGNLVTQATWPDVWLSEGCATWLTFRMTDPGYLRAVAARERIMATDASAKTRPVRLEIRDRQQMKDVYSQFVYQKAGAILLMLEGWLGKERFRKGLQEYLRAHANGTASTDDFASALPGSAEVLHRFLDRTGIPTVRAVARCEAGHEPALSIDPSSGPVPVCWRGAGIPAQCAVFETGRHEVKLNRCPAWIYTNASGTGYYRSEFDPGQFAGHLKELTSAERLTLVYDLHAMRYKGELLDAMRVDPEPVVARAAGAVKKPAALQ